MNLSIVSDQFQKFIRLSTGNKPLIENSILKNIMRIGIVTITILITTSVQFLFALPLRSQTIGEVEVKVGLNNETLVQAFQKIEAQRHKHCECCNVMRSSAPLPRFSGRVPDLQGIA